MLHTHKIDVAALATSPQILCQFPRVTVFDCSITHHHPATMASRQDIAPLPHRQQSPQRRSPSPHAPDTTSSQRSRRSSIPQSATSEDSQTVFLNHPSSSESSLKSGNKPRQPSPRPKPRRVSTSKEPRKCWICFSDETEDSPTSSEWRSPCPCALTAHEACILDWVAAEETAGSKVSETKKIQCPQCKAPITIARPRNLIVEGVNAIERAAGRLLLPFAMVTVLGTVITGCWMHGFSTVYLIFGPQDAERLLGIDNRISMHSSWGMGLPFIPLTLCAARTTMADNILPILPIFYFASNSPTRDGPLWPPSAAMTMATLPYIRAAYYEIYNRLLAPKEKAWTEEVKPRAGEDRENGAQGHENEEAPNRDGGDGVNFEVDLQLEIIEDGEEEAEGAQQPRDRQAADLPAGEPQNNDFQIGGPMPHHHNHHHAAMPRGGGVLQIEARRATQSIIGALIFPSISAAMGVFLKAVLPRTWTTPPNRWESHPIGFLQSRFGRSIAGGCLFIVLRDTLLLYSKYRLAQDHKKRRVVNYREDKRRGSRVTN